MSHVSKPSKKLLESLNNAALDNHSSGSDSDSGSDSESSISTSSSSSEDLEPGPTQPTSKPHDKSDNILSSEEDKPARKRPKTVASRVRRTRGLGKKNKTAGDR
jgi:hypothetical protein